MAYNHPRKRLNVHFLTGYGIGVRRPDTTGDDRLRPIVTSVCARFCVRFCVRARIPRFSDRPPRALVLSKRGRLEPDLDLHSIERMRLSFALLPAPHEE